MAINIDDVKQALTELGLTASTANAGVVRNRLGAGSFSTIQKHLETLRAEAQVQPVAVDAEAPPPDVLRSLWDLATAAAARALAGRIEQLTQQRDAMKTDLDSSRADLAAALGEAEQLDNELHEKEEATSHLQAQLAELQATRDADARLIVELRDLAKENGTLHETIGRLQAQLEAAQLTKKKAQ